MCSGTSVMWNTMQLFFNVGESANAFPHYYKVCSLSSHIWGNCRGWPIWTAMDRPPLGEPTTFEFVVTPLLDKYHTTTFIYLFIFKFFIDIQLIYNAVLLSAI